MSLAVKHPAGENVRRHRFVDTVLLMWGKVERERETCKQATLQLHDLTASQSSLPLISL